MVMSNREQMCNGVVPFSCNSVGSPSVLQLVASRAVTCIFYVGVGWVVKNSMS